jgi:hypothetical protein
MVANYYLTIARLDGGISERFKRSDVHADKRVTQDIMVERELLSDVRNLPCRLCRKYLAWITF